MRNRQVLRRYAKHKCILKLLELLTCQFEVLSMCMIVYVKLLTFLGVKF